MSPIGSSPLQYHHGLGYEIRKGDWRSHETSSYRLAIQKIEEKCFAEAEVYGCYTLREAKEAYELYSVWMQQVPTLLEQNGVDDTVIKAARSKLSEISTYTSCEGHAPLEFSSQKAWENYESALNRFSLACSNSDGETAITSLLDARLIWKNAHDRMHDDICFWLTVAADTLGEDSIGPLWDELMADMYKTYDRYDVDETPWEVSFELLMQIMAEALRGHLSGPGRMGDIEFVEEENRMGFRFAPCGSGGRTFEADSESGTGPRMEPPFGFGVTKNAHDWSWGKTGVCYYCVHCCQLMERMPISKFGYPARVTMPPVWPDDRGKGHCTWWVYKDPKKVPEKIYERVGSKKPSTLGGRLTERLDGVESVGEGLDDVRS